MLRRHHRTSRIAPRRRAFSIGDGLEGLEGRALLSSATFQLTQDWGSGFGGQVTIANTQAAPVASWTLAFDFDRSITSIWDASIVSHVGNHYVVTNAGWNASIAGNGGTASFGFNGSSGNVGSDKPTNYTLNGVALGAVLPSVGVGDVTVHDGTSGASATFTVSLSAPSSTAVTVGYATADGTAKAGTDYQSRSGTLTIAPGTTSVTVAVPVIADTQAKPNETFSVNLSKAVGAIIAKAAGVGTIVDQIGAPDHPPVANADAAETLAGTAVTLNVVANDTDPDNDKLTVASFTQGAHGSVAKNQDGTLTYTPAAGYLGADAFTYTVSDGRGGTASGSVAITVVAPSSTTPGAWPSQVFAPYVDMTLYPTYDLVTTAKTEGLKYFSLAFITADSANQPSWGGYSTYEVNGGTFDQGIRAQIAALRQLGGDVDVSFGGENGQELAQAITNVNALTAAYQQVINAYGLTHIDFDIEGGAVADHASIDRRSQAIAALQHAAAVSGKTLDVSFTLPVAPTGLTADGLYVLQSALHYGVNISLVNGMAMDYGDSSAPNPQGQMGTYAIDAAEGLFSQLSSLYGTTKTPAQLWAMVGITPMIGVNDASDEVFTEADASQLVAFAEQKGMGRLAMWSLARDKSDPNGALTYAEYDSSSLVQKPFAFSLIFNKFTN